jgi:hypothetical protein
MFTKREIIERLMLDPIITNAIDIMDQVISECEKEWSDEILMKEFKTACNSDLIRISYNQYTIN